MSSKRQIRQHSCEYCGNAAKHKGQEDERLCTKCYHKGVIKCKDCLYHLFVPNENNKGFFARRCPECQDEYLKDDFFEET